MNRSSIFKLIAFNLLAMSLKILLLFIIGFFVLYLLILLFNRFLKIEALRLHQSFVSTPHLPLSLWAKKPKQNRRQALALAKLLGEAGEFAAYRLLWAAYTWGSGVKRDRRKAFAYARRASLMGDAYSQGALA